MPINLGLAISDIINVTMSLSLTAAAQRNFGSLLILGDSGVIDTQQRFRQYSSLASVGLDFSTTSPEYLGAQAYFGQTPQPQVLYIGAWARTATSGVLVGAPLSAAQQSLANFTAVVTGGVDFAIDGTVKALTAIDLANVTSLTQVATAINAALAGAATIVWDTVYQLFRVKSATTGAASSVSFATAGTGTDISGLLGLQAAQGGYTVGGIVAETADSAVNTFCAMSSAWYGLAFASSVMPADSDYVAVAATIQAQAISRIFGVTTQEPGALLSSSTTDVAYLLQQGAYSRTFVQYSSSSPYAAIAAFGDAFTVDFNGSNTTITLMFKQETGVVAETLTETQAAALKAKNCNVLVNYNNGSAILQEGVMSSGAFFDVIHGTDWLQNDMQTAYFNALAGMPKVPQTDAGVTTLVNAITASCKRGVTNGLIAPGVWTGPNIGAIVTGQTLSTGFYVYAPPVSSQSQAARAARQAPVLQAAIKLAGAIHSGNVAVSVNS